MLSNFLRFAGAGIWAYQRNSEINGYVKGVRIKRAVQRGPQQRNSEINGYVKGEIKMGHTLTFFIGVDIIVIFVGLFVQMLTVGA
ncbi:MAG: hypothetical protein A3K04_02175 [Gallionellales bacterium RBG_16_56_9]|nr:MAG: hypothetical protein A3K04_02175 [Gallionellales bacterium RBG_16_56_9]